MTACAIKAVNLWLDDSSPGDATFPHALEWAVSLNLPIRAVATTVSGSAHADRAPVLDRIKTWGTACSHKGVSLETHLSVEPTQGAIDQFLRPGGLCLFSEPGCSHMQRDLFEQSSRHPGICQLLCPRAYASIRRVLILCHQTNINTAYLESAARICRALETTPIILVLAKTEREAQVKQGYVEGICSSLRLEVDFDSVVHGEFAHAVLRVVSWRHCSHLIVERPNDLSWWERIYSALVDPFCDLSPPVSILALPEAAELDVPHKIRASRTILPVASGQWPVASG